jgi:pentatricopeptide repeat protein
MNDIIKNVLSFNKSFELPIRTKPQLISQDEYKLQYNLLKEEVDEYLQACNDDDIIGVSDALGDILYILIGVCIRHGLHDKIHDIFDEIHRSNMTKLVNGKPVYNESGKVMKSKNYEVPNLYPIIFPDKAE